MEYIAKAKNFVGETVLTVEGLNETLLQCDILLHEDIHFVHADTHYSGDTVTRVFRMTNVIKVL